MNVDRAVALQEQAWSLQAEGKLEEALAACREALRLMEECEGPVSPDVANLLNDLTEIENERQNFQTALALAERALIIEDAWGDDSSDETTARIRLRTLGFAGTIQCTQGYYQSAEGHLRKALEIACSAFGEASQEVAEARNNLAYLCKYAGRFDEGLRLYQQALHTIIASDGGESLASAVVYHNIAGILHAQSDFVAAEEPGRMAWEISRKVMGGDDPRTMLDAAAYAGILDGLQRYEESEAIYRRALAIFEKAFGPYHYEVAANLHNLAAVLAARGRHEEAKACYRRTLEIKERLLGTESPDVALTYNNLGSLLNEEGRFDEALPLLEKAVSILEKRLTAGHPHLALAREHLRKAVCSLEAAPRGARN